jgi:hypothetical protein
MPYRHPSGEYTPQVELQWLQGNLIEVNLATELYGSVLKNPNSRTRILAPPSVFL